MLLRAGPSGELGPYLTAFFTSAVILVSSAAVNPFSAKTVGHMLSSSRFALSLKPSVAYLVLNFCAGWKKQTTLSSLAYAGIPYQSLGERAGALSLMIAWSRLAMVRSGSGISAIFASTTLSPSPLSALSSRMRSFIAPCSSSVNPLNFFLVAVVLLADFCAPFGAGFMKFCWSSEFNYFSRVHSLRFNHQGDPSGTRSLQRCSTVPGSRSSLVPRLRGQFKRLDKIESLGLRTHLCQVELFIHLRLSSSTLESTSCSLVPLIRLARKIQERTL